MKLIKLAALCITFVFLTSCWPVQTEHIIPSNQADVVKCAFGVKESCEKLKQDQMFNKAPNNDILKKNEKMT